MNDFLTPEFLVAAVPFVGGIIAWGFRLEGRVNTARELEAQKHEDLKALINAKFDAVEYRLMRLDNLLNGHKQ